MKWTLEYRLFVVLGMLAAGFGVYLFGKDIALSKYGRPALVDPIAEYTTYTKVRSGNQRHEADLTFKTADGKVVRIRRTLNETALNGFAARRPVTIVYLPRFPSLTRMEGDDHVGGIALLLGIGLIGYAFFKASTRQGDGD